MSKRIRRRWEERLKTAVQRDFRVAFEGVVIYSDMMFLSSSTGQSSGEACANGAHEAVRSGVDLMLSDPVQMMQ